MMRHCIAPIAIIMMAGCSASSQSVPRYDDFAGFNRVMSSLSPWKDGSADRSHDGQTAGEAGSDRRDFAEWFNRYSNNEVIYQHSQDYTPFEVPSTVRGAIDAQRKFEAARKAREDADNAKLAAEQKMRSDAADTAHTAAVQADKVAQEARAAVDAKQTADHLAKSEAEAARDQEDYACNRRRDDASSKASLEDNPRVAMARARASIHCSRDTPPPVQARQQPIQ